MGVRLRLRDLPGFPFDRLEHPLHLRGVEVADLETHDDAARDDIRRARFGTDAADGCNLTARHRGGDPIHCAYQLSCTDKGILAPVHWRRPRMIGDAFDDDVPPAYADDPLDHADIDVALVQDRALFDVQLDEGRQLTRLAPSTIQLVGVAADQPKSLAYRLAAMAEDVERGRLYLAGHRATSDGAAFFVGKADDLDRMPSDEIILEQELRHLDGADHANVAVKVTTTRNRIDVRAQHDRGQRRIAAFAPANDIAGGIDANIKARLAHQVLDVFAARDVCRAECDAADAAPGIGAERGQFGDALFDPAGACRRGSGFSGKCGGDRKAAGQACKSCRRHVHPVCGVKICLGL